jgi:hypothetical protein
LAAWATWGASLPPGFLASWLPGFLASWLPGFLVVSVIEKQGKIDD